jgi:hypothetical protein
MVFANLWLMTTSQKNGTFGGRRNGTFGGRRRIKEFVLAELPGNA